MTDLTRLLTLLVLVGLGIAWIELMRAQTLHEFPDAEGPAILGEARGRVSSWLGERRRAPAEGRAATTDVTARLAGLADLHARGELTDDEYASAKARALSE